jgi:Zn-dependent peptidase ImmA (M78 family)
MSLNPTRKAKEILKRMSIENPPVEPGEICTEFDIDLYYVVLDEDISGMLEKIAGKGSIYVNKSHHPNRQRFTIAHELGHYFLDHIDGVHVDKSVLFRDANSGKAQFAEEISANRFAAELLMPRDFIDKCLKDVGDYFDDDLIENLATNFQVSTTAMSLRLQNLGIKI